MAEINQFGNARAGAGFTPDCQRCEKELTDAIDGTLTAVERAAFDAHIAVCPDCQQMLADAERGYAWLGMLRSHRPEPPADLVDRILSRTSGIASVVPAPRPAVDLLPANTMPALPSGRPSPQPTPFVLAPERPRSSLYGLLQTRFAMTAAMAFFSVALTLNLTGVRLSEIRPRDFRPSSLRRDAYEVNAHMLRYYESLRVVYELESRVRDLQRSNEPETVAQPLPSQPENKQPSSKGPASPAPTSNGPARSSNRGHSANDNQPRQIAPVGSLPPGDRAFPLPNTPTPGRVTPVSLPTPAPIWQKGRLA